MVIGEHFGDHIRPGPTNPTPPADVTSSSSSMTTNMRRSNIRAPAGAGSRSERPMLAAGPHTPAPNAWIAATSSNRDRVPARRHGLQPEREPNADRIHPADRGRFGTPGPDDVTSSSSYATTRQPGGNTEMFGWATNVTRFGWSHPAIRP
jgi:hypothetical protein